MSKKRILVVEDDPDVAEMIGIYFSGRGFEVYTAIDGREGVAMARSKFPNLVLLDVMLPDMDGFDVCKSLRMIPLTKHIPIMFLTQRDRRSDKVSGLELGADDYITKPFDMEELRLRVQGALKRANREALYDPRSGLATRAMIGEVELAYSKRGSARIEVELVGLDGFREQYGFMPADDILMFFGQCTAEVLANHGSAEDFAGSLADDRYVIFTFAKNLSALTRALEQVFTAGINRFYHYLDVEKGHLELKDGEIAPILHLVITTLESSHPVPPPVITSTGNPVIDLSAVPNIPRGNAPSTPTRNPPPVLPSNQTTATSGN